MRLTPTAAFAVQDTLARSPLVSNSYDVINGYYPLAPWAGLAVLCGWAASRATPPGAGISSRSAL